MMPGQLNPAALATLDQNDGLTIRQQKEWGEILSGWETKNRYQVLGPDNRTLMLAGEVGEGLGAVLMRGFLKNRRPFRMEIRTSDGAQAMLLNRPWQWFFSRLEVSDGEGQPLGVIRQQFRWFERHYDIEDPNGRIVGTIEGPMFKPWTFIAKQEGREVGKILKKWSGLGREMFTDADTFRLEFRPGFSDPLMRQLLFAATFLIDFVHFENHEN